MSDVRDLFERLTDVEPRVDAWEILERAERRARQLERRQNRRTIATAGVVAVLIIGAVIVAASTRGGGDRGHAPIARTTTTLAPVTSDQYEADASVEQGKTGGPVLCLGAQLKAFGSLCSGIPLAGWDWADAGHRQTSNGITSGNYHLVGRYDGGAFTLTEPPTAEHAAPEPKPPSFAPPCPTPAGGWVDVDPARMSTADYNAFQAAAQGQNDSADFWIDNSQKIYTVAFTGDLERHRTQLRALWGGPICVVQRKHSTAELEATLDSLIQGSGRRELALGPLVSGGTDPLLNDVELDVVAATPAIRHAVDAKYGAGLVEVVGYLKPLPGPPDEAKPPQPGVITGYIEPCVGATLRGSPPLPFPAGTVFALRGSTRLRNAVVPNDDEEVVVFPTALAGRQYVHENQPYRFSLPAGHYVIAFNYTRQIMPPYRGDIEVQIRSGATIRENLPSGCK